MAEKNSHKKPVTFETPPESNSQNMSAFIRQDFNDAIYNKGYDAYLEKALKCACVIKANGDALPNCKNCGGTKWIFVNKRLTKMVSMSMNRQTKFLNWTEVDRGTISISVRDTDKLGFMDRVTNLNLVSTYAETVHIRLIDNKLTAYTIYPIVVPTEVYLFVKEDKPLKQLQLLDDFEIVDNRIILNYTKYKNLDLKEISVSVRYTHHPQYHVVDITREAVANQGAMKDCSNPDWAKEYANLPIHGVARKAHYIFDEPNKDGESLFDNTYIPSNTLTILAESLPYSLEYWLARSTGEDLVQALLKEGNTDKMNSVNLQQVLTHIKDDLENNSLIVLIDPLK